METRRVHSAFLWLIIVLAAIATFAVTALLINIFERKQEARNPFYRVVELNDTVADPAIWGKNFPMQYDLYMRTVDMERTKYGGSEADAALAHPGRSALGGGALEAGRGSAAEDDVGGLCVLQGLSRAARPRLHARRPDFHRAPAVQSAGRVPELPRFDGHCLQRSWATATCIKGFQAVNHMTYAEARKLLSILSPASIATIRKTMQLRVTRPAFIEGIKRAQSFAGSAELRRQQHGNAPGDAHLRLRPMPRDVLLQGPGKDADVSLD